MFDLKNLNSILDELDTFINEQLNYFDTLKKRSDLTHYLSDKKTEKILLSENIKSYLGKLEISPDQPAKYEEYSAGAETSFDTDEPYLFLDRCNLDTIPVWYGSILNTKGGDGDKLDFILFSSGSYPKNSLRSNTVMRIIPFAALETIDGGEEDLKVLVFPASNLIWMKTENIECTPRLVNIISYLKKLSIFGKNVSITGILNIKETWEKISKSVLC